MMWGAERGCLVDRRGRGQGGVPVLEWIRRNKGRRRGRGCGLE